MNHHKTIRTGCFETNSSSTHSVTIQKIGKSDKNAEILIENNVLYADRLSTHTEYFGNDSSETRCVTFDQKAAIVAHWINSLHYDIEDNELKALFEYYKSIMPYDDIIVTGYHRFYPQDDYSENYLDENRDLIEQVDALVQYINDNTMEIIDSDIEN